MLDILQVQFLVLQAPVINFQKDQRIFSKSYCLKEEIIRYSENPPIKLFQ